MSEKNLGAIAAKPEQNYAAFFLTLACNLRCPYCINLHAAESGVRKFKGKSMSAEEWIRAANRLVLRNDLPLTFQGGEPTLYKGFYTFVREVKPEIKMDLLTNMMFDVDEFIAHVPVERFTREAPYAAIRVSYHPGQNDIAEVIKKTLRLQDAGFRVGIYGIMHPDENVRRHILEVQEQCLKEGLDFRTKEFLGEYNGRMQGTFKYEQCVGADTMKYCECRTTEIIVDPAGYVYRCHADLYKGRAPIAHILDESLTADSIAEFRGCSSFGDCNPCDVKVKTNRLQVFGHTSVEIINIRELTTENNTLEYGTRDCR